MTKPTVPVPAWVLFDDEIRRVAHHLAAPSLRSTLGFTMTLACTPRAELAALADDRPDAESLAALLAAARFDAGLLQEVATRWSKAVQHLELTLAARDDYPEVWQAGEAAAHSGRVARSA